MKRIKSACIQQTITFFQNNPEPGVSKETLLELTRKEVERYEAGLKRNGTKYQILDTTEQEDGSILIHIKKQYNDRIDVSEYFD